MQTVSHSAITLQSWNAAGDEMPLCIQFSSSVILAHSQKEYIGIKISIVAAVRAWPKPVTTHELWYLSPSLAVHGLSQALLEQALHWRLSQENRKDKEEQARRQWSWIGWKTGQNHCQENVRLKIRLTSHWLKGNKKLKSHWNLWVIELRKCYVFWVQWGLTGSNQAVFVGWIQATCEPKHGLLPRHAGITWCRRAVNLRNQESLLKTALSITEAAPRCCSSRKDDGFCHVEQKQGKVEASMEHSLRQKS